MAESLRLLDVPAAAHEAIIVSRCLFYVDRAGNPTSAPAIGSILRGTPSSSSSAPSQSLALARRPGTRRSARPPSIVTYARDIDPARPPGIGTVFLRAHLEDRPHRGDFAKRESIEGLRVKVRMDAIVLLGPVRSGI